MTRKYDAILLVSFGGPEKPADVIPFLQNVLRGRNVPHERMLAVAEHYYHFGGKSPLNDQNRALIRALQAELDQHGPKLPVYWGNRNWHPLLPDTLAQMRNDGVQRAMVFVTSAYGSYSSCRQYLENLADAQVPLGPSAPQLDKLRAFFNHPRFIAAQVDRVSAALAKIPMQQQKATRLVYTAHSIPNTMAEASPYVRQLRETARLIGEQIGRPDWEFAYQSRSGPPSQPWLEPDIGDWLRNARREGTHDVVIAPIGFLSDHMEVLYDLDVEARQICETLGLNMVRAGTVSDHPQFVIMIRELIAERMSESDQRSTLGDLDPAPDICPADCCPALKRAGN